jgi:predicted DNA binding CopG/RHH family protein
MMARLTKGEREIVTAFERDELRSPRNKVALMKRHRGYAAATFRKDQRVNVRISSRDLDALRKRALSEGIPYQTLIASVLHRFIEGQLRAAETPD